MDESWYEVKLIFYPNPWPQSSQDQGKRRLQAFSEFPHFISKDLSNDTNSNRQDLNKIGFLCLHLSLLSVFSLSLALSSAVWWLSPPKWRCSSHQTLPKFPLLLSFKNSEVWLAILSLVFFDGSRIQHLGSVLVICVSGEGNLKSSSFSFGSYDQSRYQSNSNHTIDDLALL
jgi:hypothetical protein